MSILLPISDNYLDTTYVDVASVQSIQSAGPNETRITTSEGVVATYNGTFSDFVAFWVSEFALYTALGAPFTDTEDYVLAEGVITYLGNKLI